MSHNDIVRHAIRQRLAASNEHTGRHVNLLFGERWARESPIGQYEMPTIITSYGSGN
ncbi:hypothetical protein M408DRAFT_26323 [Serendipita vermifera MAFF 305830]|uniref:Uncharacterized protein n=1 Tax=Serendipita vermifera MAFF 305830 TaxID=933852 RepID=A0A0C3B1B6_SERVB|nr:hypothetical protein M408DRAFT_26323 [Serendipita vermifera MAFF 305830]